MSVAAIAWGGTAILKDSGERGSERLVALSHPPLESNGTLEIPAAGALERSGATAEAHSPAEQPLSGAAAETAPAPDFSEIDRLMERALESSRLPGAVIAVGQRSGVVFRRAYGERALLPAHEVMTPISFLVGIAFISAG